MIRSKETCIPPKFNIELETDGLEDVFPFPGVYSQVPCLSSRVFCFYEKNSPFTHPKKDLSPKNRVGTCPKVTQTIQP